MAASARWHLQYNFTRYYQLSSSAPLRAYDLDRLARRLAHNTTWLGAYLRNNAVLADAPGALQA